jgi:hypothetical protein
MSAAADYSGEDHAVLFLRWVMNNDLSEKRVHANSALTILLSKHQDNSSFVSYVRGLGDIVNEKKEKNNQLIIDRILKESSRPEIRAAALYSRANLTADRFAQKPNEKSIAAAKRDLTEAIAEAPGTAAAEDAKSFLFELDHLRVGMSAPDIVGKDLDGTTFRLSDYRGKVVALVFWGDW